MLFTCVAAFRIVNLIRSWCPFSHSVLHVSQQWISRVCIRSACNDFSMTMKLVNWLPADTFSQECMNCPLPNFPVYMYKTVSIWLQPFATLAFVVAITYDSPFYSHCFSVIWTKTEGAIFHTILHAHLLTDTALFVFRLLLLSAKLLVVFPSEAPNHHMPIFASEKLKLLCPYWERSIIDIVNFIWNM